MENKPGNTGTSPGAQKFDTAINFLDNLKATFRETPQVYSQFLGIMKNFKTQAVDAGGAIMQVKTLLNGHPDLIRGFAAFVPATHHHLLADDVQTLGEEVRGVQLQPEKNSVEPLPQSRMEDRVINGNNIAADIRTELKAEVEQLKAQGYAAPGLAVILVGDRTDSATYVRMKEKACQDVGINSSIIRFPGTASQEEIVAKLKELNADASVHGILVQVPLPDHMDEHAVLDVIAREKDVDGFHPLNIGKLALKGHEPDFVPCTPKGCMELLKRSGVEVSGKRAVVLGRSNIVGIPISYLLLNANATVTVCHSRTKDVDEICRQADILVAAIGQPEYVKKEWVKPGAVIIDVGINSVPDSTKKTGYRLVGDVSKEAYEAASKYTPVPGGVGPMTVAMLMQNTLQSARKWYAAQQSK